VSGRVVVLGSCGGWPEAGRACSGFLVEYEGSRVVLDLGYGTWPRLLDHLGSSGAEGLDAVVVSHAHPDHLVDVHALSRARWFTRRGAPRLPLYAPEGVLEMLTALDGGDPAALLEVFDLRRLPGGPSRVGPFLLEAWALPHYEPDVGVRLSSPGLTVAYTGDTGPDPALVDLGRDADLFIVDATDRHQRPGVPATDGPELNLTAEQAGTVAAAAGARRLMLTHFWPGNDRQSSAAAAARSYPGPVLLADEGLEVTLP